VRSDFYLALVNRRESVRALSSPRRRSAVRVAIASSLAALKSLFQRAGFTAVETRCFEVTLGFYSFEDFWQAQTPSYSPMTKEILAMSAGERARLMEAVKAELPVDRNGTIQYSARANAIKSRS